MKCKNFYVCILKNEKGGHTIHKYDCPWIPLPEDKIYLGNYSNCISAVEEAKRRGYQPVNGCKYCVPESYVS